MPDPIRLYDWSTPTGIVHGHDQFPPPLRHFHDRPALFNRAWISFLHPESSESGLTERASSPPLILPDPCFDLRSLDGESPQTAALWPCTIRKRQSPYRPVCGHSPIPRLCRRCCPPANPSKISRFFHHPESIPPRNRAGRHPGSQTGALDHDHHRAATPLCIKWAAGRLLW